MKTDLSPNALTQLRQQAAELAQARPLDLPRALALVKALKAADEFGTARVLLAKLNAGADLAPPQRLRLTQEQALCTYKDEGLGAEQRYQDALKLLESLGLRDPACHDKETLGLGGAVYKRMWESTGTLEHLHAALAFYLAGWTHDAANDLGWCGVNAAYVLDQLAYRDTLSAARTGHDPGQAAFWQAQARALREDMQARLPGLIAAAGQDNDYWAIATRAEVAFGLGDYASAGQLLTQASAAEPDAWTRQSTVTQLARLARLHKVQPPAEDQSPADWHPAWVALRCLAGDDTLAATSARRGKVGLALSGGGFRSALFHLGMLARLAECDMLRSVETVSTVSGGSIVGAQYYLMLRQLLRQRPDAQLSRADYIALVDTLIRDTVAGLAHNLRVRATLNPITNLRMVFDKRYSRSMRIGELYERWLFSAVKDDQHPTRPRRLRDLIIAPLGADTSATAPFKPSSGNWRRLAKVPNLMLNTTALNSGHNWHFTARWMGEPPGLAGDAIDMNSRYRRVYFDQAPTPALQDYPLAYAVAASSCVPVMFEPLPILGLYPDHTVRLVDGGVHDNQGMAALLDDDCDVILCSDASGQMASEPNPANGEIGVFARMQSILQDRVREAQYREVRHRADAGAVKGLLFIHMKQELTEPALNPTNSGDPPEAAAPDGVTTYGVDRQIQALLAKVRTDLDSFSEVECCALMASGYQITRKALFELDAEFKLAEPQGRWCDFDVAAPAATAATGTGSASRWLFAPLIPLMALPPSSLNPQRADLGRQLAAASVQFGRVWGVVPALGWLRDGLLVVAIAALAWWLLGHWGQPVTLGKTLSVGAITLMVALAIAAFFIPAIKYLDPRSATRNVILGLVAAVFGSLGSALHLVLLEPLLRRRGKLARLLTLRE